MRLIGRYASPFVRRVAVTLQYYGIEYQHVPMMPFGDSKAGIAKLNPVARVPVLELSDGELLWESQAIIDYLDELVRPEQRLTPASGSARRHVGRLAATALGANEKLVSALYERHFRPKKNWSMPWIEACETQVRESYLWLEDQFVGPWFTGNSPCQADLTVAVFWSFGMGKRPGVLGKLACPQLKSLCERLEHTGPFLATPPETEKLTNKLSD